MLDYPKFVTLYNIFARWFPENDLEVSWVRYTNQDIGVVTIEDIQEVLKERGATETVDLRYGKSGGANIVFDCGTHAYIVIVADGAKAIDAMRPVKDIEAALGLIPHRSDVLRKTVSKVLICYSFDEQGKAYVSELREFLNAYGIQAVTAEPFCPGLIPTKVKTLIESVDAVIGIVVPQVDRSWITGELVHAQAKGQRPIILEVSEAGFKPGILGADYETIRFPEGQISKAFTKILEGFRQIRGE